MAIGATTLGAPANGALWVGFACMTISALVFLFITYTSRNRGAALSHYLTTAVVTIASLAYLVMALGNSSTPTANGRAFLWVRYADWVFTTPLLLVDIGLLAGADMMTIGWVVFCDVIMCVAGFAGVVSSGTNAAWPLFAFGMVAFLPIIHAIAITFNQAAAAKGPRTASLYSKLAVLLVVTWTAYPIIWATGEGSQVSSVDQETIAYAFMDVVAKCVFGFILLLGHASTAEEEEKYSTTTEGSRLI
jgi:bacteriorhodopsin